MTEQHDAHGKILLRADGDAVLGSGHLRRCIALADQFRRWGYECLFACRASEQSFNYLVREAGFAIIELADGAGTAPEDAAQTIAAVEGHGPFKALIVDHYRLDAAWERGMRAVAPRIAVIDDLADRPHDCDVLVDVAPGDAERYDALLPERCVKLLGPRYALLRPEFMWLRDNLKPRGGVVSRILVSFGGTDIDGLTGRAISAIRAVSPDIAIDAVLTSLSPHRDALQSHAANDRKLTLHVDTQNMAELMASAELAVGAGGSTSWERACLGLPSIVVVTAPNQLATARALENYGCTIALSAGPEFEADLHRSVQWFVKHPTLLRLMSAAGTALVDGRGIGRVAAAIAPIAIAMRPASAGDARKVWKWRNAPEIRATAVDPSSIAWGDHDAWFARRLSDKSTVMLIGSEQHNDVGFVRFDLVNDIATVSIFLAPGHAGRGLGGALLLAGEQWLMSRYPAVRRFHADVRPGNGASIALFQGAAYSPSLLSFERTTNDAQGTANNRNASAGPRMPPDDYR